jgi:hypothetical protein
MTRLAPLLLLLLAACGGGPRGDWRAEVGRPTPNLALTQPRPPLVIPPSFDLPPPLVAAPAPAEP